jgi:hypothetical protein
MTIQVTAGEYVKKNVSRAFDDHNSRAFDIPYWFQIRAYDIRPNTLPRVVLMHGHTGKLPGGRSHDHKG